MPLQQSDLGQDLPAAGGLRRLLPMLVIAILAGFGGWTLARLQAGPAALDVAPPAIGGAAQGAQAVYAGTAIPRAATEAAGFEAWLQPTRAPPPDAEPEAVARALRSGEDSRRLAALNHALAYDVELPPGLLVRTYEQPGSEELRLLAFETHIDSLATDVEAARTAMQFATASDSPAVRVEAWRRLDQLTAYEANVVESEARLRQLNP